MLTPVDILNQEFRKSIRGYNEEEVDNFLEKLGHDYEQLYRENLDLKEQLLQKDHQLVQYRQIEDTLQNTMVLAQKSSEDIRKNAEKEADLILREARAKSEEMLAQTGKRAEKFLQDYENMQRQFQVFKTQFRSLLKAQLELIDTQPDLPWFEIAAAQEDLADPLVTGGAANGEGS